MLGLNGIAYRMKLDGTILFPLLTAHSQRQTKNLAFPSFHRERNPQTTAAMAVLGPCQQPEVQLIPCHVTVVGCGSAPLMLSVMSGVWP